MRAVLWQDAAMAGRHVVPLHLRQHLQVPPCEDAAFLLPLGDGDDTPKGGDVLTNVAYAVVDALLPPGGPVGVAKAFSATVADGVNILLGAGGPAPQANIPGKAGAASGTDGTLGKAEVPRAPQTPVPFSIPGSEELRETFNAMPGWMRQGSGLSSGQPAQPDAAGAASSATPGVYYLSGLTGRVKNVKKTIENNTRHSLTEINLGGNNHPPKGLLLIVPVNILSEIPGEKEGDKFWETLLGKQFDAYKDLQSSMSLLR